MRRSQAEAKEEICSFLGSYTSEHGRPPTIREIQHHMGYKSPRAVSYHLEQLEAEDRIENRSDARGIFLKEEEIGFGTGFARGWSVPLFHSIPAGFGEVQDAPEPDGELPVGEDVFPVMDKSRVFAVKVRGDSMVDAGIFDGDIAVMEARSGSRGDVVAALIDGETTLKRLEEDRKGKYLKPENKKYPKLRPQESLEIQGVMVGLIRSFQRR